jgi:2-polyprenyl-6-methoxyphenol hydroxylase-like FAD-dependent oxidoreductase
MPDAIEADVLVAGAGPVGLSLAMDLSSRGARVAIVETRRFAEPPSVKCNHVSARTMERFRRLGVAKPLREAGLPADHPNDVAFRTSLCGVELTRIPIPCRAERYTSREGPDTWWPTPEPPHRINQIFLEPILLRHAAALPHVRLHSRQRLLGFEQDAEGVTAQVLDLETGQSRPLRCRYLVGCDGGGSVVRKQIGAALEGTPVIQRVQSTFIRAPDLWDRMPGPRAWCYYSVNPRRCGTVFTIDGAQTWLVHNHLNPDEPEFDSVDRDRSIRNILGVDDEFTYDVISEEDWVGRRLVATRFRRGRAFIAGDAAHLWVPYAGYGMNAGIADALNLSWLLGGMLQGWGGERLLDAYEAERQPITMQVSHFAMEHAQKMIKARRAVPANIEVDGPEGERVRADLGRETYDLNVQQFCCAGLNFGYFYDRSPIIVYDQEQAPPYTMGGFSPSTVPGCRAPHFWLPDGRSLYDAFGPGYTLLCFDPALDVTPLLEAASARGVPVVSLQLERASAVEGYRHALVLCREDQHVAWRGDSLPDDIDRFVDLLRGA